MSTSGPQPQPQGYDQSPVASHYEMLVNKAMDSSVQDVKPRVTELFDNCLMDTLRDGTIFVDSRLRITRWNKSVEAMTGTSSQKAVGGPVSPDLLRLHTTEGEPVPQSACPFSECIRKREAIQQEFNVIGRSGRSIRTFLTVTPVMDRDEKVHGAVALLQDLSVQTDLQRQLRDLYAISMLDPLTEVANRAEFERMLEEYVKAHAHTGFPCSLIICDIDFFKSINDNFGHHIGDQALIAFAQLLKEFVRQQDVVARYGGEEFVILCANCNRDAAVDRAEQIRARLNRTPQAVLEGKCLTASFGVSELKTNEQSDSFFVRADQALLHAKASGRNRVICAELMSSKSSSSKQEPPSITGIQWRPSPAKGVLETTEFQTSSPASVFTEKVHRYLHEIGADMKQSEDGFVSAVVPSTWPGSPSDRKFEVHFELQEAPVDGGEDARLALYIRITVLEHRARSWFQRSGAIAPEAVQHLMTQLRNYTALNDESSNVMVKPVATRSTRDEH